jgi:peptide/nickel transport system ATP-binding protein
VIVLEKGRIVETGAAKRIFERPEHEYTKRLLASMPGRRRQTESVISKAASYGS